MSDIDLPHSAENEAGALACVFDCDQPKELFDKLSLDLFYDERHRAVYSAALELSRERAISLIGLIELVQRNKQLIRCGGLEYLGKLPDRKVSVHNFPAYLDSLKDHAARRAAIFDSQTLIQIATDTTKSALDIQRAASAMAGAYATRMTAESPVTARPIGEMELPPENDPSELLKRRFLCRRGGLLLTGPTGVGKSSFAMQAFALWSNNLPFLDITPTRGLRLLLIQAENDDGDLAEMRNGICTGLHFTEAQRQQFFKNVIVHTSTGITGRKFCLEVVRPLLDRYPSDLLGIDPALSFLGGDVKEQKDVGDFLRQYLNPELYSHDCGCMLTHHTNKPKASNENAPMNGDWAYQGSGSAEWANWARAVISLQSSGTPGVYKLHAGKRGARIGWRNDADEILFEKVVIHSREKGLICWHEGDPDESERANGKKSKTPEDLLALAPLTGAIPKSMLIEVRAPGAGIGQKKARAFLEELVRRQSLFLWSEPRPGTNPLLSVSRQIQPTPGVQSSPEPSSSQPISKIAELDLDLPPED